MTEERKSGPRWYATPLDRAAAAARARQLDALAEPDRLRVLSGVAARPDGTADAASLAAELGLEAGEVEKHIAVLTEFQLLGGGGQTWQLHAHGRHLAEVQSTGRSSRATSPSGGKPLGRT